MTISQLSTQQAAAPAPNVGAFDLDASVSAQPIAAGGAITSMVACTGGCNSPGGGSFCSWCC